MPELSESAKPNDEEVATRVREILSHIRRNAESGGGAGAQKQLPKAMADSMIHVIDNFVGSIVSHVQSRIRAITSKPEIGWEKQVQAETSTKFMELVRHDMDRPSGSARSGIRSVIDGRFSGRKGGIGGKG